MVNSSPKENEQDSSSKPSTSNRIICSECGTTRTSSTTNCVICESLSADKKELDGNQDSDDTNAPQLTQDDIRKAGDAFHKKTCSL